MCIPSDNPSATIFSCPPRTTGKSLATSRFAAMTFFFLPKLHVVQSLIVESISVFYHIGMDDLIYDLYLLNDSHFILIETDLKVECYIKSGNKTEMTFSI